MDCETILSLSKKDFKSALLLTFFANAVILFCCCKYKKKCKLQVYLIMPIHNVASTLNFTT